MCRVQDVTTVLYSFIQHMPCDLHCLHVYALNFICLFLYSCNCHNKTRQRLHSLPGKSLKPGFHYPSSRAELTAWVDGCQKMHPSWRGQLGPITRVSKMHHSSRAVNLARELGPWTRIVEIGLYIAQLWKAPIRTVSIISFKLKSGTNSKFCSHARSRPDHCCVHRWSVPISNRSLIPICITMSLE